MFRFVPCGGGGGIQACVFCLQFHGYKAMLVLFLAMGSCRFGSIRIQVLPPLKLRFSSTIRREERKRDREIERGSEGGGGS